MVTLVDISANNTKSTSGCQTTKSFIGVFKEFFGQNKVILA